MDTPSVESSSRLSKELDTFLESLGGEDSTLGALLDSIAGKGFGLLLMILAMVVNIFFQIPAMSLAISSIAVLIFSGFILYDVNRIVRGGETNYIRATVSLYLNIYNLFLHLLHLITAFTGGDD